jgi:hypothetical protein
MDAELERIKKEKQVNNILSTTNVCGTSTTWLT